MSKLAKSSLSRAVLGYLSVAFLAVSLSGQALAAEPVVIGSVMDLTGPIATLGQYAQRGVDVAVAEVNAAGGIKGRPLVVRGSNSESKPDLAANLGIKYAADNDVLAIIGGNYGLTQYALGSIAEKQKIPYVAPSGLNVESQRNWRYSVYTIVDVGDYVQMMLQYAASQHVKRIGLLRLERDFGQLAAKHFHEKAPALGIKIVNEQVGADADRDFTSQLSKIRDSEPDMLVVWFANPAGSLILKNVKQLGIKLPIMAPVAMDGVATVTVAGDAAEGVVVATQMAGSQVLPRQEKFSKGFKAMFPTAPAPNTFEAIGYDTIMIIVEALKGMSEPYTREALRTQIRQLSYEGAGTVAKFTEMKNDPLPQTVLLSKIKGGKFVLAD